MSTDPFDSQQWLDYAKHVREELIPMIENSAYTMAIAGDKEPDVKQAVELGFMVLLDKPIIAVVVAGAKGPRRLLEIADSVVHLSYNDAENSVLIMAGIEEAGRIHSAKQVE